MNAASTTRSRDGRGAIDLVSTMVGVGVLGLLATVATVAVLAVVPWVQDESARQALSVVQTAQATADASEGHFLETPQLVSHGYIPEGSDVSVTTDEDGSCYVATVESVTGKPFFVNNKSVAPAPIEDAGSLVCPARVSLEFPEGEEADGGEGGTVSPLVFAASVPDELLEGDTITGFVRATGAGLITHTVNWGAVPAGAELRADGSLTGVAAEQGKYRFNMKAKSSTGQIAYSDDVTVVVKRLTAPAAPGLSAVIANQKATATVSLVTCTVGDPRYRIRSNVTTDDTKWSTWSAWVTAPTTPTAETTWGIPAWFEAEAKCVRGSKESPSALSAVTTSNDIPTPSQPAMSRTLPADLNVATYSWKPGAVACPTGTVQQYQSAGYGEKDGWGAFGAWSAATSRNVSTFYQGFNYSAQAVTRCSAGDLNSAISGTAWGAEFVRPIDATYVYGWSTTAAPRKWTILATAGCPSYTSIRQQVNEYSGTAPHRWTSGPNSGQLGWYAPLPGWRTGWTAYSVSGTTLSVNNMSTGMQVASRFNLKCVNDTTGREGPAAVHQSPSFTFNGSSF